MAYEEYFEDDFDPQSVGGSGYDTVLPGYYQCRVAQIKENDRGNLEVDLEVITGTRPSEVGKLHKEFFTMNDKPMNRRKRLAFALAANLTSVKEMEEAKQEGRGLKIDYLSATNQHIVVEIDHQKKQELNPDTGEYEDTDKMVAKVPFDSIWSIDSKTAERKGVKVDRSKVSLDPFGHPPAKKESDDFA